MGVATRRRAALVLLPLALALTGCGVGRLQFRNDHRLEFQEPESRSRVTTPVTIRWTMTGFSASGLDGRPGDDRGVFAVFVDRSPMPVGKDLRWLARNDTACRRDPRCPDVQYLADRGVLLTTKTTVTLDTLPSVPDGAGDEQHFVNVVLLDGTGKRIGESGWYLPFTAKRRATG